MNVMDDWKLKTTPVVRVQRPSKTCVHFVFIFVTITNLVSSDAPMHDVLYFLGSVFTNEQVDVNAPVAKLNFDQDVCHMLKNVEITLEKIVIKNN